MLNKSQRKEIVKNIFLIGVVTPVLLYTTVMGANTGSNYKPKEVIDLCSVVEKDREWVRVAGVIEGKILEDARGCVVDLERVPMGSYRTPQKVEMMVFVVDGEVVNIDNVINNEMLPGLDGETEEIKVEKLHNFRKRDTNNSSKYTNLRYTVSREEVPVEECNEKLVRYNKEDPWIRKCLQKRKIPLDIYRTMQNGKNYKIYFGSESNIVYSVEEF